MTNLDEHVLEEAGDRHERLTIGELVTLIERHDPDQGPGITRETIRAYAEELANRDAPVYPEKVDDAIDDRLREEGSASGPVSWTGSTTLFSVGEDRVSAFPAPWHDAFTNGNATMREVVEFALREPGAVSGTDGSAGSGAADPDGAPEAGEAPTRGHGGAVPADDEEDADGAGEDGADGASEDATEGESDDPEDGGDAGEEGGDAPERDEGVADPVDEESDGDDGENDEDGEVDAEAGSEEGVESDDPEEGATAEDVDPDHEEDAEVTEGADSEDQVTGEDNVGEMGDSDDGAADGDEATADDATPDADEAAEAEEGAESGGAGSDPVFEGPRGVPRQVLLNAATLFGNMEWPEAQGELEELRGEGVVVEDLDQHPNPNVRLADDEEEDDADRVQER